MQARTKTSIFFRLAVLARHAQVTLSGIWFYEKADSCLCRNDIRMDTEFKLEDVVPYSEKIKIIRLACGGGILSSPKFRDYQVIQTRKDE